MRRYDDGLFFKDNVKEYTYEEFQSISDYYRYKSEDGSVYVDDITWHDMGMDDVFCKINNSNSSPGQEYLYYMLRKQDSSLENLKKTDRLAKHFSEDKEDRVKLSDCIYRLGFVRKISLIKYLNALKDAPITSNLVHYATTLAFVLSILYMIFIDSGLGVMFFVATMIVQIMSYYNYKARVEPYFVCVNYLAKLNNCHNKIINENVSALSEYAEDMKEIRGRLNPVLKRHYLLSDTNSNDGSLIEMLMSYVRMLTHVDLIEFNKIMVKLPQVSDSVMKLYETVGFFDACISIASFRTRIGDYVNPEFEEGKKLYIEEGVHPLIEKPVANSIKSDRCVLITGSNASGKSTFLRMTGINVIMAQSIFTCLCKNYRASRFYVFSSMSLNDNLLEKDSYYMVEIKSLKRILDKRTDVPVLCFVDEVLRGTNTIERIAASGMILKTFSQGNYICFAATHDIELTTILEDYYSNYHFDEEVRDGDVKFTYRIHDGRATSRNAIKLLEILGYDKGIIDTANEMAAQFEKKGEWAKV